MSISEGCLLASMEVPEGKTVANCWESLRIGDGRVQKFSHGFSHGAGFAHRVRFQFWYNMEIAESWPFTGKTLQK